MDFATGGDPTLQERLGEGAVEHAAAEAAHLPSDAETWRREVAARLERYRERRKPRAPRYPSLFLPFESPESRTRPLVASDPPAAASAAQTHANVKIGAAYTNRDGSMNLLLDALPLGTNKLQIREDDRPPLPGPRRNGGMETVEVRP